MGHCLLLQQTPSPLFTSGFQGVIGTSSPAPVRAHSPCVSAHSLLYGKGFCLDEMLLELFQVKFSFAFLFNAQNAASSLATVPRACAT